MLDEYSPGILQGHGPTLEQGGDKHCNVAEDDAPPENSDHSLAADETGVEREETKLKAPQATAVSINQMAMFQREHTIARSRDATELVTEAT